MAVWGLEPRREGCLQLQQLLRQQEDPRLEAGKAAARVGICQRWVQAQQQQVQTQTASRLFQLLLPASRPSSRGVWCCAVIAACLLLQLLAVVVS